MRAFLLCLGVAASLAVHAKGREVASAKAPSRELKYILARPGGNMTMSGSLDDISVVKGLQDKYGQTLLVFQEGGHLYVIVEKDVLARVELVTKKSEPLQRQQQELQKREERLDQQEEALDQKIERAEGAVDRANDSGDRERARQLKPQIDAAKEQQRQLQPARRELAAEERALDAKQEQVSAEIEASIQQIGRDAIAKGTAIKVR